MGSDKGMVSWQGRALVKHSISLAEKFTKDCLIIANDPLYEVLNYPVFGDLVEEKGPVGGIFTGLFHTNTELNLVLSCDMPLLSPALISFLLKNDDPQFDVICPLYGGKLQPLCALYRKKVLPEFKKAVKNDKLALHKLIKTFKTRIIEIDETLDFFTPTLFYNVNAPDDLRKLDEIIPYGS